MLWERGDGPTGNSFWAEWTSYIPSIAPRSPHYGVGFPKIPILLFSSFLFKKGSNAQNVSGGPSFSDWVTLLSHPLPVSLPSFSQLCQAHSVFPGLDSTLGAPQFAPGMRCAVLFCACIGGCSLPGLFSVTLLACPTLHLLTASPSHLTI